MAESDVRAAVRQAARELGLPMYSQTGAWHSAGAPDFILCLNGRFVGIECKTPTGRLSKLQEWERKRIIEHGGAYWVIRDVDEFKRLVQQEASNG